VLGLIDDEVILIGGHAPTVAAGLLDRMLAGSGELVTLLGGPLAAAASAHLARDVSDGRGCRS